MAAAKKASAKRSGAARSLAEAIAETAEAVHRQVACDAVLAELNRGRPPITDEESAAVAAELEEGWSHARRFRKRAGQMRRALTRVR